MSNKIGRVNVAALLQKYRSEESDFWPGYAASYRPRSKYVFEVLPVSCPSDAFFLHFRVVRKMDSSSEDVMFFKYPCLNYEEESFIHPDLILKENPVRTIGLIVKDEVAN